MQETNYDKLMPDVVIQAIESLGYLSDARIFPLNSYENRVYQVGIDEDTPIIAKFYRPQRWSDESIREEHQFTQMLADLELPVIAPIQSPQDGETLHAFQGYRFSIFKRMGGCAPESDDFDQLYRLGRLIGRIHNAGSAAAFQYRPDISIQSYCLEPAQLLLENDFISSQHRDVFEKLIQSFDQKIQSHFKAAGDIEWIRTHGDCHISNILWNRDSGPWFVDFDDCRTAPAIQDLWMMLSGSAQNQRGQISELIAGYEEFHSFNPAELQLVESLRTLRMVHYAGWLAKRWSDPAFPLHFPWFNTEGYWMQFMTELQNQNMSLDLPGLTLF